VDDGEIESGKLKKATAGGVITGAFKKAKVTIAEPAEAHDPDMDEDVAMQDMESDEVYTNLYDKDEAVTIECQDEAMGDWEEMPPTPQKARKKKEIMAGPGKKPVQVYRTGRDLHWVKITFETGFELPSSCVNLP
jgi:hypothetical protein